MLTWMVDTITDHEYYAGGYMGKDQSHAQGLLHCLHDAKLQFDRTVGHASAAAGVEVEIQNTQRLFLHDLSRSLTRRAKWRVEGIR